MNIAHSFSYSKAQEKVRPLPEKGKDQTETSRTLCAIRTRSRSHRSFARKSGEEMLSSVATPTHSADILERMHRVHGLSSVHLVFARLQAAHAFVEICRGRFLTTGDAPSGDSLVFWTTGPVLFGPASRPAGKREA